MATAMDADELRQLRRRFQQEAESLLGASAFRGHEAEAEASAAVEKKEKPLPRLNIHSAFWILASVVVTYYVEFFKTVKEHIQTSGWLLVGISLLILSLSIAFYCILYLEWYCGIRDYDIKYPVLIPLTTATFILAGICFNIALWPVWTLFTPLILFTQFMGAIMLVSLLG
ncbi:transmembrane protein 128 [Sminthopsis crassicaudata]|uniref:transmembrane protein 128 n=1 Tax=Sminthopsis crassicaudata TaxID=9301 RepID=UPI003D6878A0